MRNTLFVIAGVWAIVVSGCTRQSAPSTPFRPTTESPSATATVRLDYPTDTPLAPDFLVVYSRITEGRVELFGRSGEGEDIRLTTDELTREPLAYAPKSHEIVYVALVGDAGQTLKAINLKTLAVRELLATPVPVVYSPVVSPDGEEIAYEFEDPITDQHRRNTRIITLIDGTIRETIDNAFSLSWSAIGHGLAFMDSWPQESESRRHIRVRGYSEMVPEIHVPEAVELLRVIWNGERDELLAIGEQPMTQPNLYRVDLATGEFHQLTVDTMVYPPVVVSPDGESMAFVSWPNEGNRLFVMRNDTLATQEFDFPTGWYLEPTWSQDGRYLALKAMVFADLPPKDQLYLVDTHDGTWSTVGEALVDEAIMRMVLVQ